MLLSDPTHQDMINELDDRVGHLGEFDWEIGPWDKDNYFLAISPNLDVEKLQLTKQIIGLAPECSGWHFLPSKPVKEWDGIWEMQNENGKEISIDTDNWKYILYEFDDGTFDIDILVDNIEGNTDTTNLAIDIALTGYLGEEMFITLIQDIHVVTEFKTESHHRATPIKQIKIILKI